MLRVLIFSLWCSVSVFSRTEIYFGQPSEQIAVWLQQAHFPRLYLAQEEITEYFSETD